MRWQTGRRSANVEDRRGMRGPVMVGGGLGTIALVLLALFMGVDPGVVVQQAPQPQRHEARRVDPQEEQLKEFVSVVLADTEDVWDELFQRQGRTYKKPTLVLFSGHVDSACGMANAAVGPFYCPLDEKVYIDLSFYDDLRQRFQAPGDFAQAYVIAHEVGHHVQHQLGITSEVRKLQQRVSKTKANELSVRLELQADFFAGVWAHHAHRARNILEQGDIEEGLRAAAAIGDDRLQKQQQGHVVPDSFTHGTSEQRVRWFRKGLETGDMEQGDTFSAKQL